MWNVNKVGYRFKFLICLLIAVIFCGNASVVFAESTVSYDRIFNMGLYESADQAKSEILKAYPKGSNICPVLEYLNANTKKAITPYELRDFTTWGWVKENLHQWNPFIKDQGFGFLVERPHENLDVWRVHVESIGCRLKDFKIRLQYKDKNFVKRGLPFRFEYFEDIDMVGTIAAHHALVSLAENGNDSLSQVEEILKVAGISGALSAYGNSEKKNLGNGMYGYSYIARHYPIGRNVGNCKPWLVILKVNENNKLFRRDKEIAGITVFPPFCNSL